MDVHKDSIDTATADAGRDGEIHHVGSIDGDLASLDKALRMLISRAHRLHVVYEAGPLRFCDLASLKRSGSDLRGGGAVQRWRQLAAHGG